MRRLLVIIALLGSIAATAVALPTTAAAGTTNGTAVTWGTFWNTISVAPSATATASGGRVYASGNSRVVYSSGIGGAWTSTSTAVRVYRNGALVSSLTCGGYACNAPSQSIRGTYDVQSRFCGDRRDDGAGTKCTSWVTARASI